MGVDQGDDGAYLGDCTDQKEDLRPIFQKSADHLTLLYAQREQGVGIAIDPFVKLLMGVSVIFKQYG